MIMLPTAMVEEPQHLHPVRIFTVNLQVSIQRNAMT